MESDKVPFLLDDLVTLLTDTMAWAPASARRHLERQSLNDEARDMLNMFATNNRGLDMTEVHKEKKLLGINTLLPTFTLNIMVF